MTIYHPEIDDLYGDSLGCKVCYNYIRYHHDGNMWKDEIYFDNDWCLIRDFSLSKSRFFINNKETYIFPNIVEFTSVEKLFNKLKMVVVFS